TAMTVTLETNPCSRRRDLTTHPHHLAGRPGGTSTAHASTSQVAAKDGRPERTRDRQGDTLTVRIGGVYAPYIVGCQIDDRSCPQNGSKMEGLPKAGGTPSGARTSDLRARPD